MTLTNWLLLALVLEAFAGFWLKVYQLFGESAK